MLADKEGKTTKNGRQWTENELELFAEVPVDPETILLFLWRNWHLKSLPIKNTFEIEMDNEIMTELLLELFINLQIKQGF